MAEIAGGLGVMHPRTRRMASWWSIATLIAVVPGEPATWRCNPDRYKQVPGGRTALYVRLPVQLLFIAWAHAAGRKLP